MAPGYAASMPGQQPQEPDLLPPLELFDLLLDLLLLLLLDLLLVPPLLPLPPLLPPPQPLLPPP